MVGYSRHPPDSLVRARSAVGIARVPWCSLQMDPRLEAQANPNPSSLAGRVDIEARQTLVNIPWPISYLLLVVMQGKAIKGRDPASRAKELLQLITSLPACELEAPCAGGSVVFQHMRLVCQQ